MDRRLRAGVVMGGGDREDEEREEKASAGAPPPLPPLIAVPLVPPPPLGARGADGEAADLADDDAEAKIGPDADPSVIPPPPPPERPVVATHNNNGTTTAVRLEARGFREAVALLEDVDDHQQLSIDALTVSDRTHTRGAAADVEDDVGIDDEARCFPLFVALLEEHHEGEGNRLAVRKVSFRVDWRGLPENDMERLFGDVLPNHPTLQRIDLDVDRLPPKFFRMLAESLPSVADPRGTPSLLSALLVRIAVAPDPEIRAEVARAVADLLRRDAAVETLWVHADLDFDQCRLLCQAVPSSTNLRTLDLTVRQLGAHALDGAVASKSLLRLHVDGDLSEGAVSSLARQLRSNETLRHLQLRQVTRGTRALLDLIKTYNCTLQTLYVQSVGMVGPQIRHCATIRNPRIRAALAALRTTAAFPPEAPFPALLLPMLLGLVSDVPTVLRRVLKMGYASVVGDRLSIAARGEIDDIDRRGRRRRRPFDN